MLRPSETTPLKAALTGAGGGPSASGSRIGTASLLSSFLNAVNAMMGSGIVVLPHAFAQAGWALGLMMVSAAALVAIITTDFISEAIRHVDRGPSFRAIANAAIPHFSIVADLAVVLATAGQGCIYIIVGADMLRSSLLPEGPRYVWVGAIGLVVAPLSLLHSIDSLRFTSLVAVIALAYILGLVVLFAIGGAISPVDDFANATHHYNGTHYPGQLKPCHRAHMERMGPHPLHALGAFTLQYACQPTVPPIVRELRAPTRARVLTVYIAAVAFVWCFYSAVAVCGYYTFGPNVHTNILLMYPRNQLTFVGTLCLSAVVVCSFPFACLPFRASAAALRIAVGIFLCGTLGTALVVDSLGPIVDYVSALGVSTIGITLPALIFVILFRHHRDDGTAGCFVGLAAALVFYGAFESIAGIAAPLVWPREAEVDDRSDLMWRYQNQPGQGRP